MKKYTSVIARVSVSFHFLGCHVGTSGTWKNDHIKPEIRSEISILNKQLFNDIKKKDISALKQLLSPGLIAGS